MSRKPTLKSESAYNLLTQLSDAVILEIQQRCKGKGNIDIIGFRAVIMADDDKAWIKIVNENHVLCLYQENDEEERLDFNKLDIYDLLFILGELEAMRD